MVNYPEPFIHPDDHHLIDEINKKAVSGEEGHDVHFRIIHKTRTEEIWAAVSWNPVYGEDGEVTGYRTSIRDITERKRAEEQVRRSEQQHRTLFEKSPLGMVHFDADGSILSSNDSMAHLMGASLDKINGLNVIQSSNKGLIEAMRKAQKGETAVFEGDYTSLTGGVTRELRVLFNPLDPDAEASEVIAIFEDVSERKNMERRILEAKEAAEDATRAKSDFLARMSHEIRTPMNAIIGMSHLALQTELTAKQHDYLSKIQAGANNLLGIINDILDFSK